MWLILYSCSVQPRIMRIHVAFGNMTGDILIGYYLNTEDMRNFRSRCREAGGSHDHDNENSTGAFTESPRYRSWFAHV